MRDALRERRYTKCADCRRPLRLGATLNWGGRIAWTEEFDPVTQRTRYWCRPCAVALFDVAEYDVAMPVQQQTAV